MTTYLNRDGELVDKETMIVIGYVDYDARTLDIDYIQIHQEYPNTLQEILYDHPNFTIVQD